MATLKKTTKVRIGIIVSVLLIDIFLLPWFMKLPFFMIEDISTAMNRWLNYGVIKAFMCLFTDKDFFKLFMVLQLPVFAICVGVGWNVYKFQQNNRISDGVGGPEPGGQGQHGTSRWQDLKEMDKTAQIWHSNEPLEKGGIIFGMEKNKNEEKIWINDDDAHTLIIGATRSGKGRKIILPSIWEIAKSGESMILGDPKGELYISTAPYLKEQGYEIIVLNLRDPLKGNQWNMLEMVNQAVDNGDISKATEIAWDIANAIVNQNPSTSGEPLWKNGEESTIAALILLTALESDYKHQRHMTTAYYLLAEYGQPLADATIPLLEYLKTLDVKHPAKAAFATANIAPYKTRASFFTTALADLRLFADPNISDMTSIQDHKIEDIGIEKTAVFLIVPDEKSTRNVLATLYIDQVYQSMVELANKKGGRIPRRVNYILDEFGNLPPVPKFDKKLTVAGGRGCKFTIAVQDVAQIKKLYDKNSQTITGNCHNWIFLKTSDVETAKLISEKTGKYTVETDSNSSSLQNKGHSMSHSNSLTGRALLLTDEVLRWDTKESLILSMGEFPARYPLPDLALYRANEDFGFTPATNNLDNDKELNRQIIEERWNQVEGRRIQDVSIWLPEYGQVFPKEENTHIPIPKKANDYEESTDSEGVADFLAN